MAKESRAIPKMCGLENEVGVKAPPELKQMGPYAGHFFMALFKPEWAGKFSVIWDPEKRLNEPFAKSPQELEYHGYFVDPEWVRFRNFLLDNGSRFYLDGYHPELSTALCPDPKTLVAVNRGLYRWLDNVRKKIEEEHGYSFQIFRNNVGAEGRERMLGEIGEFQRNSFACHLNICVSRELVHPRRLIRSSIPFFVTTSPLWGAGKTRSDFQGKTVDFQITQRADFMNRPLSHDTMYDRGIFNTRDVPYADIERFMRVHIIIFDSNMLELPEYLKAGLTSILYMMLEDGIFDDNFELSNPVEALHKISWDPELNTHLRFTGSKKDRWIVDCLKDYLELFWEYLEAYHPDNLILKDVVLRADEIVEKLAAKDWDELIGKLDWVTKKALIRELLDRENLSWASPRADHIDLHYHNNNHEKGLFYRCVAPLEDAVRIASNEEVEFFSSTPPTRRSRWIMTTLERYRPHVLSSDFWETIGFCENPQLSSRLFASLSFSDPTIPWDEKTAQELSALGLPEFIREIEARGMASIWRWDDMVKLIRRGGPDKRLVLLSDFDDRDFGYEDKAQTGAMSDEPRGGSRRQPQKSFTLQFDPTRGIFVSPAKENGDKSNTDDIDKPDQET